MRFQFSHSSLNHAGKLFAFKLLHFFLLMVGVVAVGDAWNGHFLAYMGAALIAYLAPILMYPLAIWAVITAWGWAWYWAFLLFLWPLTLLLFGVSSALVLSKFLQTKFAKAHGAGRRHKRHYQQDDDMKQRQHADVEVEVESKEIHDVDERK